MTFQCPQYGCGGEMEHGNHQVGLVCRKCRIYTPFDIVLEWNQKIRLVWLRSKHVSYSAELLQRDLLPDGRVRGEGMEHFKWEKWPG